MTCTTSRYLTPNFFALASILMFAMVAPSQAEERRVTYVLPDGPDVLQAKLSGPVSETYRVVCDSLTDDACQVFPGTYQLQTFDRAWHPTRSIVRVAADPLQPVTGEPGVRPAVPTNLRFGFYSTFAGALSWDRPATPGLRYEVRRNGRSVIDGTDGTNYQERDARFVDTRYVYEVIASAPDGMRSVPSVLTIDDFEQTSGPGPDPVAAGPAAPANLRADVYSRTSAELFWDRSVTPGLRYEISRDGELVGRNDGTSFYDDELDGGTTYRYEVVALESGRRSEASTLEVTTAGSGQAAPLEIRDSFTAFGPPEAIDAIASVSGFFEASLPDDRPLFVQRETSMPSSVDPRVEGPMESVLIDIDAGGTGSYRDVSRTENADTRRRVSEIATRVHDGTSVTWAGTYALGDSSSGRMNDFRFATEIRASGEQLRLQSGELRKESSGDANSNNRPIELTYALTTGVVGDGTDRCVPFTGTMVFDSVFIEEDGFDRTLVDTSTTIEKRSGDLYWTVRETNLDGSLRDEYLIAEIGLTLFCDFPEF